MKILILNEFVQLGGAEKITELQFDILEEAGYDVKCLCFNYGNINPDKINYKKYHIIEIRNKLNKFIFNPFILLKIEKYINNFAPDKILINNLWSSPITQYLAIRKYPIIQIIHDYSPVCPNSFCTHISSDNKICKGYDLKQCLKTCNKDGSKLKLFIKIIYLKITEKLRKKYVDIFTCPSYRLTQYLNSFGYNCCCINNPIKVIEDSLLPKKHGDKIHILYVGGINTQKGIIKFVQRFNQFSEKEKIKLDIYGEITDENIKPSFNRLVYNNPNISVNGYIQNEDVIKVMRQADYLIVPSLWMENYPTVILEAMANGIVVLGSDRGGIPELLQDDRGILFSWDIDMDLEKKLSYCISITSTKYEKIRYNAYRYIRDNNNYTLYTKKLTALLNSKK